MDMDGKVALITGGSNGIGEAVAPVSYTHLDVYKRQGQDGAVHTYLCPCANLRPAHAPRRLRITGIEVVRYAHSCLLYTSRCV